MRIQVTPETRALVRSALRDTSEDLLSYFERRTTSSEDAADLLGETMLQAWRRADKLPESPERQRMWLFTIAAYTLANHHRSRRRRLALTQRLHQELERQARSADVPETSSVRDAVLGLPHAQRELVMLIHWDGFTVIEASELLGINASTARSRYAAAREALKATLRERADC